MNIKVKISQSLIDTCRAGNQCPITSAFQELFSRNIVITNLDSVWILNNDDRHLLGKVLLPTEAEEFIELFDSKKECSPITFVVNISGCLAFVPNPYKVLSESKTLELVHL